MLTLNSFSLFGCGEWLNRPRNSLKKFSCFVLLLLFCRVEACRVIIQDDSVMDGGAFGSYVIGRAAFVKHFGVNVSRKKKSIHVSSASIAGCTGVYMVSAMHNTTFSCASPPTGVTCDHAMQQHLQTEDVPVQACLIYDTISMQMPFVPPELTKLVCHLGCDGPNCGKYRTGNGEEQGERSKPKQSFDEWFESLLDSILNTQGPSTVVNAAVVDLWFEMVQRLWPLLTCFVPIVANQMKSESIGYGITISLVYALFVIFTHEGAMLWHNLVVTSVSMLLGAGSNALFETVWTIVPMFCALLMSFLQHEYMSVIMLTVITCFYAGYIHFLFFHRRGGAGAGLVIVICQFAVVLESLQYARLQFSLTGFGGMLLETVVSTIMPNNESHLYFVYAARMAKSLGGGLPFPLIKTVFALWIGQIVMFVLFRACLGAFYIVSLRYQFDASTLATGLYVYTCDFFGPLRFAFRLVTGREKRNPRRMMYAFVSLSMAYFEWVGAREVFFIRFIISCVDYIFIQSHYGKVTHQLAWKVNYGQAAFPQNKSIAWFSGEQLTSLMKAVSKLTVETNAGAYYNGVAFLLQRGSSRVLYTVKHLVGDVKRVACFGEQFLSVEWRALGSGDSVVFGKLEGCAAEGCEIDLLAREELPFIESLIFLTPDEDGEMMVNFVSSFNVKGDILFASVNLKKGDSGSPVFGLLRDGSVRYCGVVSKGNINRGGGNIVSLVFGDAGELSSDSDESLGQPQYFNHARRRVTPAVTPISKRLEYISRDSAKFREIVPTLGGVFPEYMRILDSDPEEYAMEDLKRVKGDKGGGTDDERDKSDGDEDGGAEGRKRPGKVRKDRKDRAARKRAYLLAKSIAKELQLTYDQAAAAATFDQIVRGNFPEVRGEAQVVYGATGWIIDSNFEEVEW